MTFPLSIMYDDYTIYEHDIKLMSNREFVLDIIRYYSSTCVLAYASEDICSDREIILETIKEYSDALKYASKNLKMDHFIALEAIKYF